MPTTHPAPDDAPVRAAATRPESDRESPASEPVGRHTVAAGHLPDWEIGTLEPPPQFSWKRLATLIGPGILLAGSSVGAGEWLFGPAVSAQFGGTFLWLATISIVTQAFYNLEVMRYTLYCGEPIFAGYFRLAPGPKFWTAIYLVLCIAHIWPFMAANAAVPLAAAVLGHLPGNGSVSFGSVTITEAYLVKLLGYAIFLLAFLPLIFGGKIYNVLERMMTFKLVVVLGFLVSVTSFLISPRNAWEVVSGFFRFGQVALRADTVIAGPHFDVRRQEGSTVYIIKGTYEGTNPVVTKFGAVDNPHQRNSWFDVNGPVPDAVAEDEKKLLAWIGNLAKPGHFLVEFTHAHKSFHVSGEIATDGEWSAQHVVTQEGDHRPVDQPVADLSASDAQLVTPFVHNQGFQRQGLFTYWRQHGSLPPLDWPLLAALSAIAGAGMLSNALFSNYARDKGWGMGAETGAIPSAIGGHRIALSHVGKVFIVDEASRAVARLVSPHPARPGHLVSVQLCRHGAAVHDVFGVYPQRTRVGKPGRRPHGRRPLVAIPGLCEFLVGQHTVYWFFGAGAKCSLRRRLDRPALDGSDLDRECQSEGPPRTQRDTHLLRNPGAVLRLGTDRSHVLKPPANCHRRPRFGEYRVGLFGLPHASRESATLTR